MGETGSNKSTGVVSKTVSIEKIYELLTKAVGNSEKNLSSIIAKLESNSGDISQEQLLALQARVQSWGNIGSAASGLLRAIGDALKATTQNIR
jgi:hypothetical protein